MVRTPLVSGVFGPRSLERLTNITTTKQHVNTFLKKNSSTSFSPPHATALKLNSQVYLDSEKVVLDSCKY